MVGIYIPRIIIDYLSLGVEPKKIIITIVIFCASSLLLAAGTAVSTNLSQSGFLKLRMKEFERVSNCYQNIDYKHLEDPKFRDYFEVATRALDGDGMGFQAVLASAMTIFPLIVSIISYIVVISLFNGYVVLACLLSGIITIIVNYFIGKYIASRKQEESKAYRQAEYFQKVSYDFSYGKEIRAYNLQDKLQKDYHRKNITVITIAKDFANRKFFLGLIETVCLLLEDGVSYFIVIKASIDGVITLGQVALYIATIVALSTSLRTITDKVSTLITDLSYSKTYFEFIDNQTLYSRRGDKVAIDNSETLEIEFSHVSFKYPNTDRYIFKDFLSKSTKERNWQLWVPMARANQR